LPPLAIRPYPENYTTHVVLPDGAKLEIRAIRPEDEPMMVRLHEALSVRSVNHRYFAPVPLAQRITHDRLARLCFVDYDRQIALVAVHEGKGHAEPEIIGVGRLCKSHGANTAEFALLVADDWQRRGVGTRLLTALVDVAREEKLDRLIGAILLENHDMRRLCERIGFDFSPPQNGEVIAEMTL
jgi:acetyltransferase